MGNGHDSYAHLNIVWLCVSGREFGGNDRSVLLQVVIETGSLGSRLSRVASSHLTNERKRGAPPGTFCAVSFMSAKPGSLTVTTCTFT